MTGSMSPPRGSLSASLGLKFEDLITPDGFRVWVIAGWAETGMIHCSTVDDFNEGRHPSKQIPDDCSRLAPLLYVNSNELQLQFMDDYRRQAQYQKPLCPFGIEADTADDWRSLADAREVVRPYAATTTQHVLYDYDSYFRTVQIEDGYGEMQHYDMWEVSASWHIAPKVPQSVAVTAKPQAQGQFLYRFYNRAGALLYVGITDNPLRRWKEHSKSKQWWPEVSQLTQDWYPDRASVEAAERHFIVNEHPKYNIVHNDRAVLR